MTKPRANDSARCNHTNCAASGFCLSPNAATTKRQLCTVSQSDGKLADRRSDDSSGRRALSELPAIDDWSLVPHSPKLRQASTPAHAPTGSNARHSSRGEVPSSGAWATEAGARSAVNLTGSQSDDSESLLATAQPHHAQRPSKSRGHTRNRSVDLLHVSPPFRAVRRWKAVRFFSYLFVRVLTFSHFVFLFSETTCTCSF